jgi:hypothetical protein
VNRAVPWECHRCSHVLTVQLPHNGGESESNFQRNNSVIPGIELLLHSANVVCCYHRTKFATWACVQLASGRLIAKGSESASTYQIRFVPDQPLRHSPSLVVQRNVLERAVAMLRRRSKLMWRPALCLTVGQWSSQVSMRTVPCVVTG